MKPITIFVLMCLSLHGLGRDWTIRTHFTEHTASLTATKTIPPGPVTKRAPAIRDAVRQVAEELVVSLGYSGLLPFTDLGYWEFLVGTVLGGGIPLAEKQGLEPMPMTAPPADGDGFSYFPTLDQPGHPMDGTPSVITAYYDAQPDGSVDVRIIVTRMDLED